MRYLKKFEELDFSQTIPVSSKRALTNYYCCDDCNAIPRVINRRLDKCPYCESKNIEELSADEWEEIVKSRSEKDEIPGWEQEWKEDDEPMIGLDILGKINNRKNVN